MESVSIDCSKLTPPSSSLSSNLETRELASSAMSFSPPPLLPKAREKKLKSLKKSLSLSLPPSLLKSCSYTNSPYIPPSLCELLLRQEPLLCLLMLSSSSVRLSEFRFSEVAGRLLYCLRRSSLSLLCCGRLITSFVLTTEDEPSSELMLSMRTSLPEMRFLNGSRLLRNFLFDSKTFPTSSSELPVR